MKILLISYDLSQLHAYDNFFDELEGSEHCYPMDGHCLLVTDRDIGDLMDSLSRLVTKGDSVIINDITRSDIKLFGCNCKEWLRARGAKATKNPIKSDR